MILLSETDVCLDPQSVAIPETVDRYLIAVGCYRTKVSKLESTQLGLLKTSKITRIDRIVAKLCWFEKSYLFVDQKLGIFMLT